MSVSINEIILGVGGGTPTDDDLLIDAFVRISAACEAAPTQPYIQTGGIVETLKR